MAILPANSMTEERLWGAGGLELVVRSWRPATKARGVVAIIPGFNSHSGYYGWTAEQLNAQGLAVYAVDLRGRGRSAGERFYVESFVDYLSDAHMMVRLARSWDPAAPVFVLGHSAGGVIAAMYALEHQAELAGLICESFAFQVPAPDVALAVLKELSHVAPHAHVLKLRNEDFSRDPEFVAAMNNDPLITHEVQPTRTVAEMVRADSQLGKDFPRISLPVLILHGTHDKATRPSGSRFFHATVGSTDKTLKLYEGHFHDLLNDLGRHTVMADIKSWIDAHLPAA